MASAATKEMRPDGKVRLPPGQHLTSGWPVLHYGSIPRIDLDTWKFHVWGLVDEEKSFTWDEFNALGSSTRLQRHPLRDYVEQVRQHVGGSAVPGAARPGDAQARSEIRDAPQLRRLYDKRALGGPDARAGDVRAQPRRRAARRRSMAGRCGWWCPTSTSGRARSGWVASSSWTATGPGSGRPTATTSTATRGRKSATAELTIADSRFPIDDSGRERR